MLSSVAALLFPALLLLLLHPASAQLYGCKTVNCPVDDKGLSVCPLGNSTFEYIGIANVASSISSSPLTWTVGVERSDTSSSGQIPFDRNFYLGTPPSLNVEGKTGCALFFDGVAPALARQPNVPKDAFTCKDVLEERCIADVIAQAKESYRALVDAGDSEVTFCGQLRDALVEQPPSTCDVVTGSWGDVIAKALTGSDAAQPINDPECQATTGKDYALTLVSSTRKVADSRNYAQISPILNAVTPVMTVFGEGSEADPDVQLSCLGLVQGQTGGSSIISSIVPTGIPTAGPTDASGEDEEEETQQEDDTPATGAGAVVGFAPVVWVWSAASTWLWYVLM